jgi:hypothetical protein
MTGSAEWIRWIIETGKRDGTYFHLPPLLFNLATSRPTYAAMPRLCRVSRVFLVAAAASLYTRCYVRSTRLGKPPSLAARFPRLKCGNACHAYRPPRRYSIRNHRHSHSTTAHYTTSMRQQEEMTARKQAKCNNGCNKQ